MANEKKIKYTLPFLDGANAPTQEFYSLNGKDYIIKRGEEVELPESIYKFIVAQEKAKMAAIRRARAIGFKEPK